MQDWIAAFCLQISDHVQIPKESFAHVCEIEIHVVNNFRDEIGRRLAKSEAAIKENLREQTSVKWPEGFNPATIIFEEVWGCTATCPFCQEPCTYNKSHADITHSCMQHRPNGVSGWRIRGTDVIVLEGCNFFVGSDRQFLCSWRCHGDNADTDDLHYYRDHKQYFSDWDIQPTSQVDDSSKFWCWFMAKYEGKLLDHYKIKAKKLPSHWKDITLEQAKQSLE